MNQSVNHLVPCALYMRIGLYTTAVVSDRIVLQEVSIRLAKPFVMHGARQQAASTAFVQTGEEC